MFVGIRMAPGLKSFRRRNTFVSSDLAARSYKTRNEGPFPQFMNEKFICFCFAHCRVLCDVLKFVIYFDARLEGSRSGADVDSRLLGHDAV